MHDLIGAFDEHRHHVWTFGRFEYESRDAPFEVAHRPVGALVDHALGEDVDPAVGVAGVAGGGEVVAFIVEAGGVGGRRGDVGEGVDAVVGPGGVEGGGVFQGPFYMRVPASVVGSDLGEEAHAFQHGGLGDAAVFGVGQAVGGEGLAEGKEVGAEGIGEADVVAAECPAVVHVAVECGEG